MVRKSNSKKKQKKNSESGANPNPGPSGSNPQSSSGMVEGNNSQSSEMVAGNNPQSCGMQAIPLNQQGTNSPQSKRSANQSQLDSSHEVLPEFQRVSISSDKQFKGQKRNSEEPVATPEKLVTTPTRSFSSLFHSPDSQIQKQRPVMQPANNPPRPMVAGNNPQGRTMLTGPLNQQRTDRPQSFSELSRSVNQSQLDSSNEATAEMSISGIKEYKRQKRDSEKLVTTPTRSFSSLFRSTDSTIQKQSPVMQADNSPQSPCMRAGNNPQSPCMYTSRPLNQQRTDSPQSLSKSSRSANQSQLDSSNESTAEMSISGIKQYKRQKRDSEKPVATATKSFSSLFHSLDSTIQKQRPVMQPDNNPQSPVVAGNNPQGRWMPTGPLNQQRTDSPQSLNESSRSANQSQLNSSNEVTTEISISDDKQSKRQKRISEEPVATPPRSFSSLFFPSDSTIQKSSPASPVSPASPASKMKGLLCPHKGSGKRDVSYIQTNYLKLTIDKMKDYAYQYDVSFEPDKPKKNFAKIFQQFCKQNFPGVGVAFDGSRNAYAPHDLPLNEIKREVEFVHPDTGHARQYVVNIKETEDNQISLKSLRNYKNTPQYDTPKKALQCIDIVLKGAYQQESSENGLHLARAFYLPPDKATPLGNYYELWVGLFQSTVLGAQIYLNVDISHKAFPQKYESLAELFQTIVDEGEKKVTVRDPLLVMESHLSGMQIIYNSPGMNGNKKMLTFLNLISNPKEERFTDKNKKEWTVAEYFENRNYAIRNPGLPCLRLGSNTKSIAVPMEYCSLSNRQVKDVTQKIINVAATSTTDRKEKIMKLLKDIKHNQSPIVRSFGLELDMNFATVPARCLQAPKIEYDNNEFVSVNKGVWHPEGKRFLITKSMKKWGIICVNNYKMDYDCLKQFASKLYKASENTNLNLAKECSYIRSVGDAELRKKLEKAKVEVDILFCVIPDSGPIYALIKRLADIEIGLLTQCIRTTTVKKMYSDVRNNTSTISNILLKCNAKLNGTNHRVKDTTIGTEEIMLVGADVTHPSPDQKKIPSVVGVAASHDQNGFCYNISLRLQEPRREIIAELEQMMTQHLEFYHKKNKKLPKKILYYRDGVSDGQFQQVMDCEYEAIKRACSAAARGKKNIKLTVFIVQKRHHTRFFPAKGAVRIDKNNNVPAGTIVDTEITHLGEKHFYLLSHKSIQGVARPTKYSIIFDDANHSIDRLQELTYDLCHMFSRCNRSVSYPAPTYYAHLAAYRGRVYIENQNKYLDQPEKEYKTPEISKTFIENHPMFFI
ncbi:Protein argonaute-2 [Pseudolycoriella hygida]|uniref:Protein argonaute-2 n=1 Tax=Pseudolycoriella hygida TaxID=35572 RepID=A0A9Q0N6U4_9DIPT|nr:Protein argonaute-2 [Pseudolycoriella hygida]